MTDITDSQLRKTLTKLGQKVGPITSSTRPLYLKKFYKLNNLLNESGESSAHNKLPKKKLHKKTLGFSSDESDSNDITRGQHSSVRESMRSHQSDTIVRRKSLNKSVSDLSGRRVTRSQRRSAHVAGGGYSDDSDEELKEVADISTSPLSSPLTPRRPLRQRLTTKHKGETCSFSSKTDSHLSEANGVATALAKDEHSAKPVLLGSVAVEQSKQLSHKTNQNMFDRIKHSLSSKLTLPQITTRLWDIHCSSLLPIGTVVFFIVLGLLYVTLRSDENMTTKDRLLEHTSKDESLVVNKIFLLLAKAAGRQVCYAQEDWISIHDLKADVAVGDRLFIQALKVIDQHPEWGLLMYTDDNRTLSKSFNDVHFMRSDRAILPTFCRFQRAVGKVIFRVGGVLAAGMLLWLVVLYKQYRNRKANEERQMMFILVEKVLDVLKSHHESSLNDKNVEPFLAIVHARDMIIPPQDRKSMLKVWERAVHFISASESRIRVENQRIAGQDFLVWRWIQVTSPSKKLHPPGRVWQGEAFDTNKSINVPIISPTPCLKIRNMFNPEVEKGKEWHLQIQDSILEKCLDNNEILNIVVEKKSSEGLVYVRCASCAGAGRVFRSLHGSWFDGRLVTVKFIKLSRFNIRYPHLESSKSPLKPSSKQKVSTFRPPPTTPSCGSASC